MEESIARLEAVTLEQVRKLYAEQLGGQAGELVVVGDFDPAPATKQVDDMLKDWKATTPYQRIARPAKTDVKGEPRGDRDAGQGQRRLRRRPDAGR